MTKFTPPFSTRTLGKHRQIDNDFPDTARTGLFHLLVDLVERHNVEEWKAVARELQRIARLPHTQYESGSVTSINQAKSDVEHMVLSIEWEKLFDFCERLYSHLAFEYLVGGWNGSEEVRIPRSESQAYIENELQRLFVEERFSYEFSDGMVRRQGRKHTNELSTKAEVVMGDPQLIEARRHFDKALQFFRHPTKPDYENTVKEAVCAVEAAGKKLFPTAKASTLGELAKWFGVTKDVTVPKALAQTITGVYAFRSGGDGIGHGGATGGAATVEVAEYILAVCASQIIYFVDLSNSMENDIPF